jgi:hypothetical protein
VGLISPCACADSRTRNLEALWARIATGQLHSSWKAETFVCFEYVDCRLLNVTVAYRILSRYKRKSNITDVTDSQISIHKQMAGKQTHHGPLDLMWKTVSTRVCNCSFPATSRFSGKDMFTCVDWRVIKGNKVDWKHKGRMCVRIAGYKKGKLTAICRTWFKM